MRVYLPRQIVTGRDDNACLFRFADRVAAAGIAVFPPVLFGEPGRPLSSGYAVHETLVEICIRREFAVWASDRSGPIIDLLRAPARKEVECAKHRFKDENLSMIGLRFSMTASSHARFDNHSLETNPHVLISFVW